MRKACYIPQGVLLTYRHIMLNEIHNWMIVLGPIVGMIRWINNKQSNNKQGVQHELP